MTTAPKTPTPLVDAPVPVQVKLAAAWTSLMFLYIYVDYLHLYKPGAIRDILAGVVSAFEINVTFAVTALALQSIPSLMIVLSTALPARVNRATNLVVATLLIPYTAFNAVGERSWLAFYLLGIVIEVLLLAFILRSAWTWSRSTVAAARPTSDLHRGVPA